jgi:hypothetical protein
MTRAFAITLNALGLYAIALVLAVAFGAQLLLHELPSPLCLLQRIAFTVLAVGPIMNIRWGSRPSHYALSLLAAVAGVVFSTRQVLLHIMPGDAGWHGPVRLSLLYAGPDRLRRFHRPDRSHPAVRSPIRRRRSGTSGCARRFRDLGGVARDRFDGVERGFDAAGVRPWRLRR